MGDGIEVRFTYRGATVRPRLRLKATSANLMHANRLRQQIMKEIAQGTFNMLAHFPDYKLADKVRQATPTGSRTFKDWVDVWEKLSERDLEFSTLHVYKRHMAAYWTPVFGSVRPVEITHERILSRLASLAAEQVDEKTKEVKPGLSRKTQNNILIPLRSVFELISRAPGAGPNPCDGIDNLKVQTGNPDPFSLEEVELALADIRQHNGDAAADYFEFAAFAGLRVSEHIALLWEDVDLRTQTIVIKRVKVLTQKKDRTKTTVERAVELNARAAAVLQRQRARTQANGQEVFWNTTLGRPWNDEQMQRNMWRLALRRCGIRHRPPKELRDSSVTFALQAGADPWYVARQHGHSLTVMMKDYAKWIPNADRGRNRAAINTALAAPVQKEGTNDHPNET